MASTQVDKAAATALRWRRSGLPRRKAPGKWWRDLLLAPFTWLVIDATAIYFLCAKTLYDLILTFPGDDDGQIAALLRNHELLPRAAGLALPTLLVLTAVFILSDRWRPQRWGVWWLALGWGASVAVLVSFVVNSWAGAILGSGGEQGANWRTAVFIAPFVEEAAKASGIFLLVALLRYRMVTTLGVVSLAALSGVGFAFSENIVYYMRAYLQAYVQVGVGDPVEAMGELAMARGVWTAYGHPFFTSFVGIGMAMALRNRSRTVRILMPVAGWLGAALAHMQFNNLASTSAELWMFQVAGGIIVVVFLVFVLTNSFTESDRIRTRLNDYARMGWMEPRDVDVLRRGRSRIAMMIKSSLRGPKRWWHTVQYLRAGTELAHLRDLQTRGLVAEIGHERELQLLQRLQDFKSKAISDPSGVTWIPRRTKLFGYDSPSYPGPAGIGGQLPAPVGTTHAPVDPSWGPPS